MALRDEIANERFAAGTRLPSEHRLADRFGVSRITVRRALDGLAAAGLIEKRNGAGSIVLGQTSAEPHIAANFATLMPQLVEFDRRTTAKLLSFVYTKPPKPVAKALGLQDKERVQSAVRIRYCDGKPFSHLTTHVPEAIAQSYDETDLTQYPLFRLLERSGVRVESAHQSVTAALAAPDVADALQVEVGSPLLSLTRVVKAADGRGVEHLSALYQPDLFRLEMTLTRVGAGEARQWQPVIGARGA